MLLDILRRNYSIGFIHYITGSRSFPTPLTPEEEKKVIDKMLCGDETSKNILIEKNLRLVAHITKKYNSATCDNDDLISIGTIGLIKGISSFKPDKGIKLATYIARCIENEILMYLRTTKKYQNDVSLHEPIGVDKEGNEINLLNVLSADQNDIEDKIELKMQIDKLYNKVKNLLKGRERIIIESRYGLNNKKVMTQREIAKQLGISRSYVSRIEKKAIKKLAKEF